MGLNSWLRHRFAVPAASKLKMRARYSFILILLLSLFTAFSSGAFAQAQPIGQTVGSTKKRFNLYGKILGSIELPVDYRGYMTADYMDAWAGFIESKSTGFKVDWRAGTIVYVLEKRKNDIEWRKDEKVGEIVITRASLKEKRGKTLVTKIGWMEFSSFIRNEEDERSFASLIGSYQKGSCTPCLPFRRKINN